MDAIRYNGRNGAVAENEAGKWTRPDWCPLHADADAGESQKKCRCTKLVGEMPGQVSFGLARLLVKSGSFDPIDNSPDPEE